MNTFEDARSAHEKLSKYRNRHRITTRSWNAISYYKSDSESSDWSVEVTYLPSANLEKIEDKIGKIANRIGVFSLVDTISIASEYETIAHNEHANQQLRSQRSLQNIPS